ncbi:hypothetical protein [Stutzerimonas stutzeri]|uniref:hypothetical protein n=1 Tax=Stutzerimonas stutzeri TaxID=316 RepID=UPI00265D057C|nr:hypothetical protein [Stutzerimonas stutzeri]MCF6783717.1 hypothetical protein [Stutzerimonas stutzeri]
MNFHYSSMKLDQYGAANKLYGMAGIKIGELAKSMAAKQVSENLGDRWAFCENGVIGYWAPEEEHSFTVDCPGTFSTLDSVDSKSLGIAFTIMAINHMVFDAYHQGDELLCEQLVGWQEELRSYAFETEGFDGRAICNILD